MDEAPVTQIPSPQMGGETTRIPVMVSRPDERGFSVGLFALFSDAKGLVPFEYVVWDLRGAHRTWPESVGSHHIPGMRTCAVAPEPVCSNGHYVPVGASPSDALRAAVAEYERRAGRRAFTPLARLAS